MDQSLWVFLGLSVVIIGGCSILAGRALAENWKPAWQVLAASLGLTVADRFLGYALFGGDLFSPWGFLTHYALVAALGLGAWRITRASKYVRQYPWKYERRSLFTAVEKKAS